MFSSHGVWLQKATLPATFTWPLFLEETSPRRVCRRSDLPQPAGPVMTTCWPLLTVRSMRCRMGLSLAKPKWPLLMVMQALSSGISFSSSWEVLLTAGPLPRVSMSSSRSKKASTRSSDPKAAPKDGMICRSRMSGDANRLISMREENRVEASKAPVEPVAPI